MLSHHHIFNTFSACNNNKYCSNDSPDTDYQFHNIKESIFECKNCRGRVIEYYEGDEYGIEEKELNCGNCKSCGAFVNLSSLVQGLKNQENYLQVEIPLNQILNKLIVR
jgi:hypothetical protein